MLATTGNNDNDNIFTNNWTDVINQDARSMDDAYLGKVKGLYEAFIVLEKGIISKQKLYIPRSPIKITLEGICTLLYPDRKQWISIDENHLQQNMRSNK